MRHEQIAERLITAVMLRPRSTGSLTRNGRDELRVRLEREFSQLELTIFLHQAMQGHNNAGTILIQDMANKK